MVGEAALVVAQGDVHEYISERGFEADHQGLNVFAGLVAFAALGSARGLLSSLERAKAVSKLFIARGIPAASVSVAGRGQRELVVQTAPNKSEPLNRRVEITVR